MSNTPFRLSEGSFVQDWSNAGQIATNDDWSGVPSIIGFRGDGLTSGTSIDPRTITQNDANPVVDVNANQTNPNTFTTGGVAEFALADPTVALAGSTTAKAPYLDFYLDSTGRQDVTVSYVLRDLETGADNAQQQVALQYRTSATGPWTNVPDAYVADATSGPNVAGPNIPISVTLPADANDQPHLQVRVITTDAVGSDEWVGVDNIAIASNASSGTSPATLSIAATDADHAEGNAGTTPFTFTVTRSGDTSAETTVHYAVTGTGQSPADASDFTGGALPSGDVIFAAGQTSAKITIPVAGDTTVEPNEAFAVTLSSPTNGAVLGTASATGTIRTDDVALTHIYDIQGSGAASSLVGQTVTTQGVVTAISNGASKGFYVQDVAGDGNAATSDGIFVFTGSAPTVHEGDVVNVTGTVQEFLPSGAARGSLTTTELSSVTSITTVGTHALPAPVAIGADGVHIPNADITAANAAFESLEGMLVTVKAPLVVGPTNSFGEIFTVADSGTDASGLNNRGDLLISAGTPSFGNTDAQGGDQNPERIQIDPGLGITAPKVSTGALLGDVTGVVGYDFGDYQVLAKQAPVVAAESPLTKAPAALKGDAGHLLVASYNAENLDPGDGAARFSTIANEITTKLNAPDVIALQEVQDNNGPTDNGVTSASTTLQMIVDAVKAAGGPQYASVDNPFIGNDTNGGEPGGNIRTAFLYRTDRVGYVQDSLATVAADGSPIKSGTYADQQTNPDNPFFDSRPPLSASFTFNGQQVTVLSDHFTSKGGSGALYGSEQPPFDAGEVQRAAQAQAVNSYVDRLLAADPSARVVVAGDLNDFGFEQPLSVLKGTAAVTNYDVPGSDPINATATYTPGGTQVLNDLQDTLPPDQRFDYVFEGNAETLDHMLATNALAAGAKFQPVHINAEFYDQTSDHDPLLVSFAVAQQLTTAQTVSGQQSFALGAGGTLSVASGPAIRWDLAPATTGTNATVDNAGAISATSGRAIDTIGKSNGDNNFTLINHEGATIVSPGDAFRINADLPNGVVTVDNAGAIRAIGTGSANGQALDFNALTSASVSTTIVNEATGVITAADADAIRPGVNATINNHGMIVGVSFNGSTGNDGIDFQDVGYGNIHNFAGGLIEGARHGVTGKLPITVENDSGATIKGDLGSGINLDTASTTTTTIANAGTITGHAAGTSDGDGIDVDGLVAIDNHGLIEATGTWNGGLSEAITVGGGTIINEADGTIHSVQRAITVDDSNLGNAFAPTAIINAGTIRGDDGAAIAITDTFADTLTNKGAIVGSVALGGGDDVINDYAGATFSAGIDGGAGSDTLNLYGPGAGSVGNLTSVERVNLYGGDWTLGSEGFQTVALQTGAQTLRLATATVSDGHFDGTITGFGTDDILDVRGIGTAASASLDPATDLLSLRDAQGHTVASLQLGGDYSGTSFTTASDGAGGTTITVKASDMSTGPLNIVLTNDDGYNAPGIQTLYTALSSAGYNVHIVAPAVNQSAQGSSLGGVSGLVSPIGITEFSPGNYYVDGRPATATLTALDDLFGGHAPDLVISGTNRGDNIGESENISGTVNGALQGLFEGVPAIAVSAGSFQGDYTAAFANAANFVVDFLGQLRAAEAPGQPILPAGEGLSINVPGNPVLAGAAVTTITAESSSYFPYMQTGTNTFAEGFVTNTSPSGSPTSEGSQFLTNHITISPVDGNWGGSEADRAALAVRLGASLTSSDPTHGPLNILLLNEDGHSAHGLDATRDALLAKGYNVTVLAPSTDQSGVGSALFLNPVTVTEYEAKDYAATGTPATLVALGLDPQGLFHGQRPDLVVVGADQGDAVGIENANHSATLAGAVTALFNYGVPSIAVSSASGSDADLTTGANFVASLIQHLQTSQGSAPTLLPTGVGLSVNVPTGASAANYAFTTIDKATDHNLSVTGDATHAAFSVGGPVVSGLPHSEGDAFNAGKITVSPIDGNFASANPDAYDALAHVLGTTYGTPSHAPATLSFQVSEDAYQGDAQFAVFVNGHQIGGAQTVTASHAGGQSQTVTLLDYFDSSINHVDVRFLNDLYDGNAATDRNLYVDKLTLNGNVFEGEAGANSAGLNLATEAALYHNGSLTFDTASDTLAFRVSEDAYQGDAQFQVLVDGRAVGGIQTAHTSHASGQYETITLHGDFSGAQQVAVQFLNDRYDGPGQDRNLYVDSVSLNDTTVSGHDASVPTGSGQTTYSAELWKDATATFNLSSVHHDLLV